jgi:hypothetical protein
VGALSARAAPAAAVLAAGVLAACSPEADRVRDGGAGADPGNKVLVEAAPVNPVAADTTLWPGRAPAPVERFAGGQVPPATFPARKSAPADTGGTPVTPDTPPSESQQRTFDRDPAADPRRPSGGAQ